MKAIIPFILTILTIPCLAATYTVDDDGPADFNSIQAAVDTADNNDTVIVYPGIYYESVEIIDKAITLRSTDPNDPCTVAGTIIDGNNLYCCVYCDSFNGPNSVISGFTIRDGNSVAGGGIQMLFSDGLISNCIFINNTGGKGGAINYSHKLEIESSIIRNCAFIENSADFGGAIYLGPYEPTIENCTFIRNTAESKGGAIHFQASPIIKNCSFTQNSADEGGAAYTGNFNSTFSDCRFYQNTAFEGGAVATDMSGSLNIENCIITDNSSYFGGGFYIKCENAIIVNSTFSRNHAELFGYGGALYVTDGNLSVSATSFTGNSAFYGGAVHIEGQNKTVNIANSVFSGNYANSTGALNHRTSSPLNLTNCVFIGNSVIKEAVLANCSYNAAVSNCIFWGNFDSYPSHSPIYDPVGIESFEYTYSNIQGGWPGIGNIDTDPCFVDPGYWDPNGTPTDANDDFWVDGDYHLKSEGWRWDCVRSRWDYDDVTSRCIDAGNPGSPLADEPLTIPDDPNNIWGHNLRINMGAYGGTPEASMAPYDWALLSDINNSGIVDFSDYAWFAMLWLQQNDELFADFNRDTNIDTNDLFLLAEDWLSTTTWH